MDTERAKDLINKFHLGTLSPEEEAILDEWYLAFSKSDEATISDEDLQKRKLTVLSRLDEQYQGKQQITLWPKIAWLAAAIAIMVFGIWIYADNRSDEVSGPRYVNDVRPGKNEAILTFSNGEKIRLSDAKTGVIISNNELSYNDNTVIRSMAKDKSSLPLVRITASTPRGGTYQFTLPDGTKVWLNADSKLEFPSSFASLKTRNVKLSGEAYFEVEKDKAHPFIVESQHQAIEVLGTHFNVNSYLDETSTTTTLLEGSVKVNPLDVRTVITGVVLKPNQQLILNEGQTKVRNTDGEAEIAWKNGNFIFKGEELERVLREIGRWYDMEIFYQEKPVGVTIIGAVSRSKNLSAVLEALEQTGKVHFKIEERRITVMR